MKTKIIEATNGPRNHGKFLIGEFDEEWSRDSVVDPGMNLLSGTCGWGGHMVFVLDLQTGEGAYFKHGGYAHADLEKHAIWVCPLFEPFLTWLYEQPYDRLWSLPDHVDLPDAPFLWSGHRRPGPAAGSVAAQKPRSEYDGSQGVPGVTVSPEREDISGERE